MPLLNLPNRIGKGLSIPLSSPVKVGAKKDAIVTVTSLEPPQMNSITLS